MFDISTPQFWVSAAFILLVALSFKKIGKLLAGVLDGHAAKIKAELDAARQIRMEAEETLRLYKRKQLEFSKEAEEILAKARADAAASSARAQAELKAALDIRTKQAVDKIAQEESAAIADIRGRIVAIAVLAAHNIISEQMNTTSQDELIKFTISDIEQKIH